MVKLSQLFVSVFLVTFVVLLPVLATARTSDVIPQAHGTQTSPARVEQLLQQAGYAYQKVNESVWVIDRTGKSLPKYKILIATGNQFVVLGVIIAPKAKLKTSAEMMFKLLKMNHSLDYEKVGFDDDDDLFVRTEIKTKLLDLQEFKERVDRISTTADNVHSEFKSFIIP